MALSATFTANFSNFYDAVTKAESKLKDFGTGADRVGGRLSSLTNQFSGIKIVQEATVMAKAIEDIGGASMLTAKELQRVGATAQEAVEKMKKLGMDVPKNIQDIADKTKTANVATTDWLGTITKIAGAVGIAFSVSTITNFIGSIFDAASAVKDLSDQWGVSTTTVQQWTGAAKQSGVEASTVGKSVQFLTQKIAENSTEYQALLANVGLSSEKLKKMTLKEQYEEVIRAIGGIKDEAMQLDVAQGLLGDSSKKMVGAIRDGFLEAAAAQKTMSEETIQRLADAQAAWEKFTNAVITYSGEMLAGVGQHIETMTSSWGNFFGYMGLAFRDLGNTTAANAFLTAKGAVDAYQKKLQALHHDTELATETGKTMNTGLRSTADILAEVAAKEAALKKALADRVQKQRDATREQDEFNKKIADYKKSVDDLAADLAGDDLIAKAVQYQQALEKSIPVQQMTRQKQDEINKVMMDAIGVYEAAGQTAPLAIWDIALATEKAVPVVQRMTDSMTKLRDSLPKGPIDVPLPKMTGTLGAPPPKVQKGFETFEQSVTSVTGAFAKLGDISGGVLGDITGEIANVVGAMNVAQASTKTFQSGLTNLRTGQVSTGLAQTAAGAAGVIGAFQQATKETGKLQSTLNGAAIGFSVAGPWGAAVGAAAGLIKGFFNASKEKKETRNLRNQFVDAAGGADVLRQQAEAAGISLDRLFAAKKKGDLEAEITKITEAFKFQQEALGLVVETAQRYGFTLEELGPALQKQELDKQAQQLFKDWEVLNSAGIDTVEITEKMAGSVNDYVQHALKMGVEVPAAMRPMLESFAKSGQLLDENGGQITDLEGHGLSFTMTMSEGFKGLIGEVKLLTDAIARGLGLAIKNTPDLDVDAKITPHWVGPHTPAPEPDGYARGTDGFKNFGTGTPVILHGWEAVVPRDEPGAFATVAAGGSVAPRGGAAVAAVININAQGAFFDTPGDLQRLAAKVNDALTAKFGLRNAMRAG